jgi:superfamily I DNA and RNA helicase
MFARVKEAIRLCYSAGFKKHDVAIISYHGREQSQLLALDRIGQTSLRHFTGEYDLFGQPVYTKGEVLVESVYRFKGQAAPAIILTEIDFDVLDDQAIRKLFVGATRSSMKLILILHQKSAARLLERMG